MIRRPPRSPLFPYTTLSRSRSARPEIILLPGKIRVNLAGLTSYSLPLHTTAEPPPSLAPDVFLALAMLLGGLGHFAPAAVLVDSFFPEATLHNNPEILWKSMLCLFQARRIHEALQLAESYIERDPLKSGVLILPALAGEPPLTTAEDQALRAFFERNLVRAKR